jgi:hypothetical protein
MTFSAALLRCHHPLIVIQPLEPWSKSSVSMGPRVKPLTFQFDVLAISIAGGCQTGDKAIDCRDLNKHHHQIVFLELEYP